MGTSVFDDLIPPRDARTTARRAALFDDLIPAPRTSAPPASRDRFADATAVSRPEPAASVTPATTAIDTRLTGREAFVARAPAPFRRAADDLVVAGSDVLATVPRLASVVARTGAHIVEHFAPNRVAPRLREAQGNLSALADELERYGAPRDRAQMGTKLLTGVAKYGALGPAAGMATAAGEAAADPRFSQTQLLADMTRDHLPAPVSHALDAVASNPVGRAVGDVAINVGTSRLIGLLGRGAKEGARRLSELRVAPSASTAEASRGGVFLEGAGGQPAGAVRLPGVVNEPAGTAYTAPIDEGANPRITRIARLNLAPEAEAKVREAYTRLGLEKRRVTWDETRAAADELGLNPRRLLDKSGRLRGDEALAVSDVISTNAKRMVALAEEHAAAGTDEARQALQGAINALSEETDGYLRRFSTERTRAGRDLNALKIVARNSMDPAVWMTQAQRVKGPLALTGTEAASIATLTASGDRDGLVRFVSGLHQSTGTDKLLTLWKAGLLTNPVTHEVNTASNLAMAVGETVKEIPAAGIDAVISAVRGTPRTKSVSLRGLFVSPVTGGGFHVEEASGVRQGLAAARRVLQYGDSPAALEKWDFRKVNFGDGPGGRIAQAYTDAVFHSLSAEDKVFRAAAMGRALEEQARLAATRMVKAGTAPSFAAALGALRQQMPAELVTSAIADAEIAVFQNENGIARGVSAFKRGLRDHGAQDMAAMAEVTMPFVKTPTNVTGALVQYSPLGLVRAVVRQIKAPSQKMLAEDLGRTLTGSGLVALGFMLAAEGKATGTAPRAADDRAQWELEGKTANSVRLWNRWWNVSRLPPLGALLAVGAQMHDAAVSAKSASGALAAAAYTPARVAMDQSFLRGVSGSLAALNDPSRFAEALMESTAGSVVPAGVAAVARGTDPLRRDPTGPLEAIEARIPGVSERVPPRLNAFGQPVAHSGGVAKQFADIFQTSPAHDDPLLAELGRLDITVGFPGKVRTTRTGRTSTQETRPADEQRQLLQSVGPATEAKLRAVLTSKLYARWDDATRRERLQAAIGSIRARAYREEKITRRTRGAAR